MRDIGMGGVKSSTFLRYVLFERPLRAKSRKIVICSKNRPGSGIRLKNRTGYGIRLKNRPGSGIRLKNRPGSGIRTPLEPPLNNTGKNYMSIMSMYNSNITEKKTRYRK